LWDFLFDIERVSVCMPGVERVEALEANTYQGTLKVKVGPVAASFSGKVRLLEVEPPRRLVAKAEGTDARSASMVSATFTSTLTPIAEDQTQVAYRMDVGVRGLLGRFGHGVMSEVAKRLAGQFAQCVEAQLRQPTASPGGPELKP
jgi:carbon monoxide dehydrogenase subunit G